MDIVDWWLHTQTGQSYVGVSSMLVGSIWCVFYEVRANLRILFRSPGLCNKCNKTERNISQMRTITEKRCPYWKVQPEKIQVN
jgi:hypothetical protein